MIRLQYYSMAFCSVEYIPITGFKTSSPTPSHFSMCFVTVIFSQKLSNFMIERIYVTTLPLFLYVPCNKTDMLSHSTLNPIVVLGYVPER